MKFTEHMRFDEPYWFNGVYKISKYVWFNGGKSEPYFHAYISVNNGRQWGNFVGGYSAQCNRKLTFKQCVELCIKHSKNHKPTKKELINSENAKIRWIQT